MHFSTTVIAISVLCIVFGNCCEL